jgi:4-amino-4-deoxy-L-arabinose transferase-like glycosyltransferase
MTTTAVAAPTTPPQVRRRDWQPYALGSIVALSLLLYGWGLGSEGFLGGNPLYSAAIKSMSENVTNFLFGSYDPAGVVTVDKPPMSMWPQVVSSWIFGYHGWSILLPQVVEGAAAVFLLHRTVRRWAGENAALLAALILALTPITVAINRDNNPDTALVLLCVAAAYAFTRSVEPGISARSATKWLWQSAFWIGCGFTTKMLAGWMIIPAVALAYLAGRDTTWGRRLGDLLGAGVVLLVSSLWWVALTAFWPGDKPYIGGSTDGSAWDLVVGYNGLGRIVGQSAGASGSTANPLAGGGGGNLFGTGVGGQISWLIPLSLLALAIVAVGGLVARRAGRPANHFRRSGWVLWGTWLIALGLVFSLQKGTFHSYYTTQIAPPIAALAAAGLAMLWRQYRAGGRTWVLLPAGIALTAVWTWVVISRDTSWNGWVRYVVAVAAVLSIAALVGARLGARLPSAGLRVAAALGLVAILVTPAVWSGAKALTTDEGFTGAAFPSAGSSQGLFGGGKSAPGMPTPAQLREYMSNGRIPGGRNFGGGPLSPDQTGVLDYVTRNAHGARIALAVEDGTWGSASYIINSDVTVIGLGGFWGTDDSPSVDQLAGWKNRGELGFVLSEAPGASKKGVLNHSSGPAPARIAWVQKSCAIVPPHAYGVSDAAASAKSARIASAIGLGAQTLYDCTGA